MINYLNQFFGDGHNVKMYIVPIPIDINDMGLYISSDLFRILEYKFPRIHMNTLINESIRRRDVCRLASLEGRSRRGTGVCKHIMFFKGLELHENKFTINQDALSILLNYIGSSSTPVTMSYCFNNIINADEWENNVIPRISRRFVRSSKNITILKPSTQDDVRNMIEPRIVPSEELINPF